MMLNPTTMNDCTSMQTRAQALAKLNNPRTSADEREQTLQYLHYLDAEGLDPKNSTSSAKRPAKKSRHKPRAGKT